MDNPVQRNEAGRWAPGVSGNPSGRPAVVSEIQELARARAPEAFKRICELIASADERTALAASQEILNRAYGKPTQSVDSTVKTLDVGALYVEALKIVNDQHRPQVVDGQVIEAGVEW